MLDEEVTKAKLRTTQISEYIKYLLLLHCLVVRWMVGTELALLLPIQHTPSGSKI
jgi:hypothetical protein